MEAYTVSVVCGLANPRIVLMAAVLTLGMFLALTLYACTTKSDFTIYGGALFVFSILMLIGGLFLLFTDNNLVHIIFSILGVFLFSIYIIYDT